MENNSLQKKTSSSNDFVIWFKKKFIPAVAKLGNQRHLAAIRDSFGTMIPLIIAGSIGTLINAIIFGGSGSGYVSLLGLIAKAANQNASWDTINLWLSNSGNGWYETSNIMGYVFNVIYTATLGMMAIWFSFLFGYYIALSRNFKNPLVAGLVSGASFIVASLGEVSFFMGSQGLITAIIFGIIATEIFIKLSSVRQLNIKLPDGVPPAVGKSFAVFLPAVITLSIVALVNVVVLAPAIVTGNLYVTTSTYDVLSADQFSSAFGQNYTVDSLVSANSDFNGYTDLLNQAASYLNTGTPQQFVSFYNGLDSSSQAVVANALATWVGAADSGSSIATVSGSAQIIFVEEASTGQYVATIQWLYIALTPNQFGIGAAIYQFFTSWFISFATSEGGVGIAILFAFFVSFFWFFGIHGSNIMAGIFEPIWYMILGINTQLITTIGYDAAVSTGALGVFTKPFFDSYMYVGGSGATLGLLILTLSFSKRKELKEIARYATPAGIFQINEPTIFGFPLILNPVYVTPFIVTPILNVVIGWIFSPAVLNFVKYSYIATPWTAPWFVGGLITSLDVRALLPAFIIFGVDLLMYLPFVLLDNRLYFRKLKRENMDKYLLEIRYSKDPEYKWNVDTETKYNAKIYKSELVISHAEETNDFWAKRITDEKKLALRQKSIMDKALIKQEKYKKQAVILKIKRNQRIPYRRPRWNTIKAWRELTTKQKMEKIVSKIMRKSEDKTENSEVP